MQKEGCRRGYSPAALLLSCLSICVLFWYNRIQNRIQLRQGH
ncbi:hypothetical protein CLOBOL_01989 [Enterocloster bolteae ATCC BAA-613]|uniref:Uncharacterized protein n=1 Tax=Enterocloster bolteae (strain ATCC BAA-613 / DSM 15670 / CCUG 46953 / JCM 12243 / WAL 16351) TaxID=411902 RepID=A8RMQ5_ENTBW|nr:hypothetical protein CLOBOL_01989 [Enterocloster bolteae ATCC BAA-613]